MTRRPFNAMLFVMVVLCATVILVVPASVRASVGVSAVRYWTAPDHTRVVVDLSEEATYSTRVLTNPHRVVVLVVDGTIEGAQTPTVVGDGLVDRVRINQLSSGVQVVLDLTTASAHNVFPLKPYMSKPNRVVIDVYRGDHAPAAGAQGDGGARDAVATQAESGDGLPRVVVIDAGHGGEDPGTLGNGKLKEKDVVLDIGKKLAALLKSRGGYDVRMTRDGDYFVRLAKRKEIANKSGGELFISIHANSAPNKRADGTEIFYISPRGASDQAARELADRENAADLVGGVSPDADEDVLSILVDLKMSDSVQKSHDLAGIVDDELARARVSDCAVKQAGFLVLKSLAMPSILVEVGFLTNAKDVDKLKRTEYRQSYAECLAHAVDRYFDRYSPVVARHEGTHKVAPGETLWSIARRYDISVEELRSMNGLDASSTVLVDQILNVSGS